MDFELVSPFKPAGDQPQAIEKLLEGLRRGEKMQTLMGVTGSGKTFTMANVIAAMNRPTLVVSHNKTLAAQLFAEFKEFFPHNAVSYFVSYYDYYQPEAYIPQRDIYIEKDAAVNQQIDRLRLAATSSLVSRRDVIVVASVSSIFGLGSPTDYVKMILYVNKGDRMERDELLSKLVDVQYERDDYDFTSGKFRVRGDCVDVFPTSEEHGVRIEFWGDEIDSLSAINPTTGEVIQKMDSLIIFPAKHFVLPEEKVEESLIRIRTELNQRLEELRSQDKLLEMQRLSARTRYDIEMIKQVGYCPGIENYSRHLSNRQPGEPPDTLYSFFPDDFLLFVDESHVTIPQIRGMQNADRNRKKTLIEHGFRLPSALDNRPLTFPDLLQRVEERIQKKERVLVTTLTKRLAEDVSAYFVKKGIRCKWLHSELDAFERVDLLKDLREGAFDVLVGVNLLREGLDLPEVSLVAILDADKEGFLRSETSLMQTIGRSARNVNAKVILYGDKITPAMQNAIDETARRRALQEKYNKEHHITPKTIQRAISKGIQAEADAYVKSNSAVGIQPSKQATEAYIQELQTQMLAAADNLEFERAAMLRDKIEELKGNRQ